MRTRRFGLLGAALTLVACDRATRAEGGGDEARGNAESICAATTGEQGTDLSACRVRVEELLARGVRAHDRRGVERRVLARAQAERLQNASHAGGPPSIEEIERAAEAAWPKHNDGPIVSVVHALFPTARDADARAEALARALGAKPTAESFEAAARAAGSDVVVERIDAIGNRGRTVSGVVLERAFADAAVRLTMDSPRSDSVHTSYGTHVVLLLRRNEPAAVDAVARENALVSEAYTLRARDRLDELVARAAVRVEADAPSALKSLGKNR